MQNQPPGSPTVYICNERFCTTLPDGTIECSDWQEIPGTEGCALCGGPQPVNPI